MKEQNVFYVHIKISYFVLFENKEVIFLNNKVMYVCGREGLLSRGRSFPSTPGFRSGPEDIVLLLQSADDDS